MPDEALMSLSYTRLRSDMRGFGRQLGPIYRHAGGERLAFRVTTDQADSDGFCHGGALATFCDMQGPAIQDRLAGATRPMLTINLTIDFVHPVPVGALVEMEVTLVRATGRLLFTQALLNVAEKVVARSNATYRWAPALRCEQKIASTTVEGSGRRGDQAPERGASA